MRWLFNKNGMRKTIKAGLFFATCTSIPTFASDEITEAVLRSPSSEGYIQTETGIHRIYFDVIDGMAIIEGDIVLGPANSLQQSPDQKGLITKFPRNIWPGRTVPYAIDPRMGNRARILTALDHWRAKTGITFVERTQDNASVFPNFVYFTNETNQVCNSYVGMQGGAQKIQLADACSTGSTIHEIGHAIGIAHEHMRSDRDQYVQVFPERIQAGKEHNFSTRPDLYDNSGSYDYGSIMHYPSTAFSRDGSPTIIAKNGSPIGQRSELSNGDIATANRLYPRPSAEKVCVTMLMLNQPYATGIGDIDIQVNISGVRVVNSVLPYQGPYGHPPFEVFKFWASKGTHSATITSSRGGAALSIQLPVKNDTTALQVQFWGQRNGRPARYFSSDIYDHYDDINDTTDCDQSSPSVSSQSADAPLFSDDSSAYPLYDERMPVPNWPTADISVVELDRLEIPDGAVHKVPLGVVQYKVKELIIGNQARIWFPYDLVRFNFSAERSKIGNQVQFVADGGPGAHGTDNERIGSAGGDGGVGGNAPTLTLNLGQASIGDKLRVYLRGGNGGPGGMGGSGRSGFNATCIPPQKAEDGGSGGPSGYAGSAGAGGLLFLQGKATEPLKSFRAFVHGGSSTVSSTGGAPGRGGAGVRCIGYKFGPGSDGAWGASRKTDRAGRAEGPEGRVFYEL